MPQNKETKITITLPSDSYFISGIRDFTLALGQNLTEMNEQWAYRLQSVVDEICNNAVEYGSTPGDEIKVTFISVKGESLAIEVEDKGTGKNKTNAAKMTKEMEENKNESYALNLNIRGRGLTMIVNSWTDELEFKDSKEGGIIVRVKKYIKKP